MIRIRYRIMLWVAGAGLVTSLVFSLAVYLEMREQPLELLDAQLAAMADGLSRQLAADGRFFGDGQGVRLLLASEQDWVKVYDQRMRLLFQSSLAEMVELPFAPEGEDDGRTLTVRLPEKRSFLSHGKKDRVAFRVLVESRQIAGHHWLFQLARPIHRLDDELGDLLAAMAAGLLVSTLLLLVVSYVLAGRIVRPIALITRRAREINADTLEKRIPVGASDDELAQLSRCMNQMFDRLQHSFDRQKQYLSDASHELKSPLTMLRIFFEDAASHHQLPADFQQQLEAQRRNVRRMERLVKTMLELSLLEVRNSCHREPLDLTGLLASVIEDFEPLLEKERLRLVSRLPSRLDIRGDRDALRRVMINILDNAVKYNRADGLIEIDAARNGNRIRISVLNTGPGVPAAELEKVFEQFYRVEKSRSLEYGGAGLGLAMVEKIVRMHGGVVRMESREGEWAKIILELPVSGTAGP